MENANAGDEVEFRGLKATNINGSKGELVKFVEKEEKWIVRCHAGKFKTKPECLILLGPKKANPLANVHPSMAEVMGNTKILSGILSFLHWKGILTARVCRKWRVAARVTDVPESKTDGPWHTPEIYVQNRDVAESLGWISDALPMIPSVNILFNLANSKPFKIADGNDSAPRFVPTSHESQCYDEDSVDIGSISNFRHLRNLSICGAKLNGSYAYLFDFPNLRRLELMDVGDLKWDLTMLRGLPKLEELRCIRNSKLTGSLKSVRVLRQSLIELTLSGCTEIEGNLMHLADFPKLKDVSLNGCDKIVGDIREIGPNDFSAIEEMTNLPDSIYGGGDLPSIAETPAIMRAWSVLKRRNPLLFPYTQLHLSDNSPERYDNDVHHSRNMPTGVQFVNAGPRLGWRWTNSVPGGSCETIWLDPKPDQTDERYEEYVRGLKELEKDVEFYKGFFEPPTQSEHLRRNKEVPLDPMLQGHGCRSRGFW